MYASRIRWPGLLVALLLLAACGPAASSSPAPPPGPTPLAPAAAYATTTPIPQPQPTTSPTALAAPRTWGPVGTPVHVPTEAPPMPPEAETVLTPKQADAQGLAPGSGALYDLRAEVEGTTLHIWATKPTPCHRLVAEVQVDGPQVWVHLYTRRAPDMCIGVLQPVTASLDLQPYLRAAGTYTVVVNQQVIGQVTWP